MNKDNLTFLISIFVLFVASIPTVYGQSNLDHNAAANLAMDSIMRAESAGADTSELVRRFNYALDLIRQAERSDFSSCSSYDHCLEVANKIFRSISDDSGILGKEAKNTSFDELIFYFIFYAPVVAFASSFFLVYFYRSWKSYQIEKLFSTEVRRLKK